jgi:pseudouridine-5'-phosphate glycosidase/pseudouridine kinase
MFALCGRLCHPNFKLAKLSRRLSNFNNIQISEEVRAALQDDNAVVALESTIITHGMPYPQNVMCALEVEAVVRTQGAVPATVAIVQGQIRVGLDENELSRLGDVQKSRPIKTARRDLAYVVGKGLNGGTTVSGTLVLANKVGIPVFATGGIGGVHREGETTLDISADLTELGKCGVAVVSSGVKSILDIPKTLEYLETEGVFVATFGDTTDFPAFYSRKSGCHAPYSVGTAAEAAKIIHWNRTLNLQSGMLFAVPVPEQFAFDENVINDVIAEALEDAKRNGIRGKEITPFLLGRIGEITAGKSLETNVALIKNNARTAACIATELATLKRSSGGGRDGSGAASPVVIGGSNLDCSIKLETDEIKMDGRIHLGKSVMSGGGVARNICEALIKLGCRPLFISVLGDDPQGSILKKVLPQDGGVEVLKGRSTGQCTVVLDSKGECKFLAGDMDIHQQITPQMILENEEAIKRAPLIVFDANLSIPTIDTILKLAGDHDVPVLFEPTDLEISIKPFQTDKWRAIKFITPNLSELRHIASHFEISRRRKYKDEFDEAADVASKLTDYVNNVIVTLGAKGVIVARKGEASDSFFSSKCSKVSVRHYPANRNKGVVSVSGAGDSLASGLIAAMIRGLSEEQCVAVGLAAAQTALTSTGPVAKNLFGRNHEVWKTKATFKTLL